MSAQAAYEQRRTEQHPTVAASALAAGLPALAAVAVGGLSLGLFLWYADLTRFHTGLAPDLAFAGAMLVGLAAAASGWYGYSSYFARRAGIGLSEALRWDAISWALLGVYAVAFTLPASVVTPSRAAFFAASLWAFWKLIVAVRFVPTVRDVSIDFVCTRLPIIVIAELAAAIIAQRPGEHVSASNNPLLSVWGRWDAVHYVDIARRGYYGHDMAFFPLFPWLIRILGAWLGNLMVAGVLISNAAFFFGLLYLYKLVEHQYNRTVARRAVFYVSIFPTAVFFSAVYSESLFFALTVASFYYIREHRWLPAGILGGLAALTRSEGILLMVPFAMEAWMPAGIGRWNDLLAGRGRQLRLLGGMLLIPLGLAIFMAYLWVLRGDPLYFSHVQVYWDRHLAPPWVSVWHSIRVLTTSHSPTTVAGQALELAFTALMLFVFFAGFRRLRPSFSAYMALSILVPLCTSSLMSMPRFALVLFPMFVIMALWGGRAWVNTAIVAFSLPLLGLFTVLFANWYWVA